jgi:hypothetical protein
MSVRATRRSHRKDAMTHRRNATGNFEAPYPRLFSRAMLRHSRGLDSGDRVSARQSQRVWPRIDGFATPVSAGPFLISVLAWRRPVRTETGSRAQSDAEHDDDVERGAGLPEQREPHGEKVGDTSPRFFHATWMQHGGTNAMNKVFLGAFDFATRRLESLFDARSVGAQNVGKIQF